jgi:hypothetical protein
MEPFIRQFATMFGMEILYSFVIIVCSLIIYFGTKELYELSSYKGIKYFRKSFLFIALAYFFGSFIKLTLVYFDIDKIFGFSPFIFRPLTLIVFIYFSSMAIFYLLYSIMWKKWNGKSGKIYLFHSLALIVALVSVLSNNKLVYIGLNFLLFLFVLIIFYIDHRDRGNKAKSNNLYIIYVLLFIFLILNIIDILIPEFLQNIKLLVYLTSLGVFLAILYRVTKKLGPD